MVPLPSHHFAISPTKTARRELHLDIFSVLFGPVYLKDLQGELFEKLKLSQNKSFLNLYQVNSLLLYVYAKQSTYFVIVFFFYRTT